MKRFLKTVFTVMFGLSLAYSVQAKDIWTSLWSTGNKKGKAAARLDFDDGNLYMWDGNLVLGAVGDTPSTTSGDYWGIDINMTNNTGSTISAADLVLADPYNSGSILTAAVASTTTVIGVAMESIADSATGRIRIAGLALVNSTGTVTIGDVVVSTDGPSGAGSAGYVASDTTPITGSDVGVAVTAGSNDDQIVIRLR